ncbi:pentapeptide repeat-containing protein [Actinoallomurus sp. NPDC052308]|uniref:pentapeptide repeat-containing protein n=1 Tax=Actinoallomurus sp. NPDC052308 TaxID=3155530 RepID=UPI0034464DEC
MPNSRPPTRLREPAAPRLPSRLTRIAVPDQPVGDDQVLLSLELHGGGWAGIQAEDVEVNRCRFTDAQIPGVILPRARLEDVELTRCDLANLQIIDGRMFTTRLANSRLTGLAWIDCSMRDMVFTDCRANLARFRMSALRDVIFRDCDLTEASFQAATLNGVLFENCRLAGTQFSQAKIIDARFKDCDLSGLGGVESLRGATVSSADAQSLVWALASAFGIRIED